MTQITATDPRFTSHNADGTTTCGNHRLIVTLPTDEFNRIGRYGVFNDAMRMLGNRSEAELLLREPVGHTEVMALATEMIVAEHLAENCRYNLAETLMRMAGGHRMSPGMAADVGAAQIHAARIMADDYLSVEYLAQARETLERDREFDISRRSAIGQWCRGWKIEIVGQMPEQIGLCRYEVAA